MSNSETKKNLELKAKGEATTNKQVAQTHLLNRDKIQAEYGLSRRWLELAALKGNGPAYVKIGSRTVLYRREELERWLEERKVRSTSDITLQVGGAK